MKNRSCFRVCRTVHALGVSGTARPLMEGGGGHEFRTSQYRPSLLPLSHLNGTQRRRAIAASAAAVVVALIQELAQANGHLVMTGPSAAPEVAVVLATFAAAAGFILLASWVSYRRGCRRELQPSRRARTCMRCTAARLEGKWRQHAQRRCCSAQSVPRHLPGHLASRPDGPHVPAASTSAYRDRAAPSSNGQRGDAR